MAEKLSKIKECLNPNGTDHISARVVSTLLKNMGFTKKRATRKAEKKNTEEVIEKRYGVCSTMKEIIDNNKLLLCVD